MARQKGGQPRRAAKNTGDSASDVQADIALIEGNDTAIEVQAGIALKEDNDTAIEAQADIVQTEAAQKLNKKVNTLGDKRSNRHESGQRLWEEGCVPRRNCSS